ncbi:MAG: 1-acyl-sn-glycerol-3-phosphate acyltransferase [Nitrospira sp. CR1.3]|nr:1-acyl-sn-glycerol-3-phosphate acyltransferase [Nitrospira sp. CR1.3]
MSDRIVRGLITPIRALGLMWHVAKGVLIVAILFPYAKPKERDVLIRRWSLDCLRILNVHVRIRGDAPPPEATAVMFVANHVSWLDILALNAVKRVRFVAKSEVRAWPVIGWLAARTGTLFLRRRHPGQLIQVNRSLQAALKRGECVAIFPEGTTSDGRTVLRFHSGLLEPAVTSHSLVWPVALRYHTSDGQPAAIAAFVGEQTLVGSTWQVLSQPALHMDLHFIPALAGSRHDRHELAQRTRAAILSKLSAGSQLLAPNQAASSLDRPDDCSAAA